MLYTLIGIERIDYVSRKTNMPVVGKKLHCTYTDESIEGMAVESIYINDKIDLPPLELADNLEVFYNKYGQVASVRAVE